MKEYWACGRTRDVKGNVEGWHLNPYVNCIHTLCGHSRLNMEVLVAEFDMEMIERDTPMKGNHTEPRICTMVGRDPNNPKSRKKADGYVQMLEIGDDVSNTLTSVQKDNLVAEPNVLTPKRTEFGKKIRKKYESGEVELSRHEMTQLEPREDGVSNAGKLVRYELSERKTRRGRVQEGGTVSPTLMASGEAPCLFEGVSVHPNSHALEFKGEKSIKTDVSPALRATDYKAPHCVWENSANYRIRKLTPKECFRLMGVSERDIEKIQNSGVSQSQQYKMAGNSIVVDVLEHIFRKLFVDTGQESQQLLLF